MARCEQPEVVAVLRDDYGPRRDRTLPDLTPDIRSANLVTNQVAACATKKGITLPDDLLKEIEIRLACHAFKLTDPGYRSRSTGGASGSYEGETGMYLEATKYGQYAMVLDYSGCLRAIGQQQQAEATIDWLGVPNQS